MKIGLFFGTFDPVHRGHIEIGRHVLDEQIVDKIWFVITPKSPFKSCVKISSKEHRINMLSIAIKKYDHFLISDIEFKLKPPYYTSNTLYKIKQKYPNNNFTLIMGSDNYENIERWKDAKYILNNFQIYVYKRFGHVFNQSYNSVELSGNYIDISSTAIRNNLELAINHKLLNTQVATYIYKHSLYKSPE